MARTNIWADQIFRKWFQDQITKQRLKDHVPGPNPDGQIKNPPGRDEMVGGPPVMPDPMKWYKDYMMEQQRKAQELTEQFNSWLPGHLEAFDQAAQGHLKTAGEKRGMGDTIDLMKRNLYTPDFVKGKFQRDIDFQNQGQADIAKQKKSLEGSALAQLNSSIGGAGGAYGMGLTAQMAGEQFTQMNDWNDYIKNQNDQWNNQYNDLYS